MMLLPAQTVVTLYLTFAALCAMPWLFNWASHGTMPITARLLALFLFVGTLASGGELLWTVHDKLPARVGDVLTLLFPMLFFSALGIVLVMRSLVEMVKKSESEQE